MTKKDTVTTHLLSSGITFIVLNTLICVALGDFGAPQALLIGLGTGLTIAGLAIRKWL